MEKWVSRSILNSIRKSFINLFTCCLFDVHSLPNHSEKKTFLQTWKEIPPTNEVQSTIPDNSSDVEAVKNKLEVNNIFTIAQRSVDVGGATQVNNTNK